MAVTFDQVKTWVPSLGEYRAYIFSSYQSGNLNCVLSPSNAHQCQYLAGEMMMGFSQGAIVSEDTWQYGQCLYGFNELDVGSWVTIQFVGENDARCYEVVDKVDENTFNTGTCTVCPPTSNCTNPPGCLYNNFIIPQGLGVGFFSNTPLVNDPGYPWLNGTHYFTYNVTNCDDCITNTPTTTTFSPNIIVNCCDPSERYIFPPTATDVYDVITGTGQGQFGVTNHQQAFYADFWLGGLPGAPSTGYKCWHVDTVDNALGPLAMGISYGINNLWNKYPDCGHLSAALMAFNPPLDPCCDPPVTGCTINNLQGIQSTLDSFKTIRNNIIT